MNAEVPKSSAALKNADDEPAHVLAEITWEQISENCKQALYF